MSAGKEIIFEEEARSKLREGIDTLADVVGVTIGPRGRNVGLQTSYGPPSITNDGNSIVKDVESKDQYVNLGISMGKEMVMKMKEACGDGTTSCILILRALVHHALKNITAGASPIFIQRGMKEASEAVIASLDKSAIAITGDKETRDIAIAAASGQADVGNMIADSFKKGGKGAVILVEEGKGTETVLETVEGMQFDRGYISGYFATDSEMSKVEMKDARILITDKKISSIQEILPLLQAVATSAQELLIIAEDVEGDALSTLVINKLRGTLKVCAIKAPAFGDRRKAMLQDLAILTGGTLVTEDAGVYLKDATADVLGRADKIVVTKEKTTIVSTSGKASDIDARKKQIAEEIKRATSPYDKEKLEERKAKLSGGILIIRVGASSEPEMKQKKQLFEDSLNSTRAALEEGIVAGGGVALLRASRTLKLELSAEERIGSDILRLACEAPFRRIVQNSGADSSLVMEDVLSHEATFGFNADKCRVEDLIQTGVVDPAKVTKHALRFAVSTAGIILLSEVLIGDAPEKKEEKERS